ncbi:MAG: hypothetical protein B7Y39_10210 [Bdellovibrio sp. 28-41-41]|nr:MAG: hypothetical protein B7Y39_10210 [Bdellovibrio sp. 28-41-41]
MLKNSRILVTGADGLVGKNLIHYLLTSGYTNVISIARSDCDLADFTQVKDNFEKHLPEYVFHLAAKVYGIGGNLKFQGTIFYENTLMNTYVIEAARVFGVKKILCMGTIAAYPDPKKEPVSEVDLWEGPPHASEASYGHAKRGMLAQLQAYSQSFNMDYSYVLSTNLYGPYDKFDAAYGHVLPSLISKFFEGKKTGKDIIIWGDGSAARDFLYSVDAAVALVKIMDTRSGPINLGTGQKTFIRDAVQYLSDHVGVSSQVKWDTSKPNGRKYYELDIRNLSEIGFKPSFTFKQGLLATYDWYAAAMEHGNVRT